jgi:4-coumarate--CoA ligase
LPSCANPTFTADELVYQLETTKAILVIAHPACLDTTLKAARTAGLPIDRIVSFDGIAYSEVATVSKLIQEGLERDAVFTERRLDKGEAKTKIAFLSFSSGTTGRPKVSLKLLCST